MLILALAIMHPVAAQSFKPDYSAARAAHEQGDYATALKHLRPLAKKGHAKAQHALGIMFEEGKGVTQDYKQAVKWWHLSAKQGHDWAQADLGMMYLQGKGVTQDYAEALRWTRPAAKQGHADAQFVLGMLYYRGFGVLQDLVMAYVWLNIAVTTGKVTDASEATDTRDEVRAKFNALELKLARKLSKLCFKDPAKCPKYSDD